jgi:flavin reductase (DIM6/NTAB) family NADH-FMN oxidoreductase RutF
VCSDVSPVTGYLTKRGRSPYCSNCLVHLELANLSAPLADENSIYRFPTIVDNGAQAYLRRARRTGRSESDDQRSRSKRWESRMDAVGVVEVVTNCRMSVAPLEFKDTLSKALTPVTVVATDGPGGLAGLTCSAVCSVCDEPPIILLCINRKSFAASVIKKNGVLSVNWLAAGQSHISQTFAGVGSVPMERRFDGAGWDTITTGAPCRMDAAVSLDCEIANTIDVGSHSVIFARVVAKHHSEGCSPLVYHRRQYATTRSLME